MPAMAFRDDRRAAALQVGAVLLLGFLVVALSLYQATVVPEQNERVEFQHSQRVQGDMLDLRNAILRAGTGDAVRPVSIRMGTTYEPRVLFVNPPPPGGSLRSESVGPVTLRNARATDDETADFLRGGDPYALATRRVSYRPGYNVYRSAPTTTYQSGVAVNELAGGNDTAISGQSLVRGNEIYLVAVAGNLSRAQVRSSAVDPRSLSTATRSTTVTADGSGNPTLTVPTTLSAERWRTLLGDEYDPGDRSDDHHVATVSETADGVRLELDGDVTYRLRTALVGVGTGASAPGPAYLARVDPAGGADVAVEVRDRYNNPVPNSRVGESLTVNVTESTDVLDPDGVTVGADGRAQFAYTGETGSVNLTLESGGAAALDGANGSVTFEVTGSDRPGGGSGDGDAGRTINPPGDLVLADATVSGSAVGVTFENADSGAVTVTRARFSFYHRDSQGTRGNGSNPSIRLPGSVEVDGETLNRGGAYADVALNFPPGRRTLTFTFYRGEDGTAGTHGVQTGDFFVISVVFDDGSTATYFVAPE